jgi:hypothetical protein
LEKGTGIKELPNKIGTQNPMHFLLLDAETSETNSLTFWTG